MKIQDSAGVYFQYLAPDNRQKARKHKTLRAFPPSRVQNILRMGRQIPRQAGRLRPLKAVTGPICGHRDNPPPGEGASFFGLQQSLQIGPFARN
jgi:hypothetical protein